MEQVEIYKSAWEMSRLYGANAASEIGRRAAHSRAEGDTRGCTLWLRVKAALEDMITERPAADNR